MIEEAGQKALRRGQWKYIPGKNTVQEKPGSRKKNKRSSVNSEKGKAQLYNLDSDVAETDNIVDQHPEIAREMAKILQQFIDSGRIRE